MADIKVSQLSTINPNDEDLMYIISNISGSLSSYNVPLSAIETLFHSNPTFISPDLGIPASGQLSNCSGLPLSSGGIGELPIENGGTNSPTASAARVALGLEIGVDVQAYDSDLDSWAGKSAPTGDAVGTSDTQTLTNKTLTDPKVTVTENAQTGTTYTLVLTDASKLISMNNASANTLTIPTNASVAFAVGTCIVVLMKGAGTTSISGDTGVTVNGVSAGSGDISGQWGAVSLYKTATDTWYVMGSIGTVA